MERRELWLLADQWDGEIVRKRGGLCDREVRDADGGDLPGAVRVFQCACKLLWVGEDIRTVHLPELNAFSAKACQRSVNGKTKVFNTRVIWYGETNTALSGKH